MNMNHYQFSGTAYEQGLQHGYSLKMSIKKNVETYYDRFLAEAAIEKKDLLHNTKIYLDVLRNQSPEYVNAINGISEGSECDLLEIAMLNLRYELLYHALGKRYLEESVDGCTSFALLPEVMKNNHLIMGQNWDWIPDVDCVLVTSIDVDGLKRISFTEAGIFAGKPGMNSEGIGLAVNGMYSVDDDWCRLERPFHLRCYDILRSKNMERALKTLTSTPRSCTANFILGHAPHRILNIELGPNKMRLIDAKDGVISHANHFSNPSLIGISEPHNPRRHLSEFRQKQMEALLMGQLPLNITEIQNILQDHENHPQSLCRHRDKQLPKSQHTITKIGMIMDLYDRKMWVTNGNPCKNDFESFEFI